MKTVNLSDDSTLSTSLDDQITAAITEAHTVTEQFGIESHESAVAWDIVEELQAEAAHKRADHQGKTAFSEYCEEFPDAVEARIYDV